MDADELQARSVALEELRKQPEKDGPHLLVLERTHMCEDELLRPHFVPSFVLQSGKATSTSREWREHISAHMEGARGSQMPGVHWKKCADLPAA